MSPGCEKGSLGPYNWKRNAAGTIRLLVRDVLETAGPGTGAWHGSRVDRVPHDCQLRGELAFGAYPIPPAGWMLAGYPNVR